LRRGAISATPRCKPRRPEDKGARRRGPLSGRTPSSGTRAIFAGCARNCAAHLPAVLRNIETMSRLFEDSAFVFVENDSTDATKSLLAQWGAARRNFHLINLDGLESVIPQRTLRLEMARNAVVAFVRGAEELAAFDTLIVTDLDAVNARPCDIGQISKALALLHSDESHAGVFGNNLGPYNDMWALRHPELCPGDSWEEVFDYSFQHQVSDREAFEATMGKRAVSFRPDDAPIEVDSAFNGFGIYRLSFVRANRNPYLGSKLKILRRDGQVGVMRLQTCEHVHFHLGLRAQGGKLFLLPSLTLFETVPGKIPPPVSIWRTLIF
jgi:hypothetical protein